MQDNIKMETGRDCLLLHSPLATMTSSGAQGGDHAGLYQGAPQQAGQHGAMPLPGSLVAHTKVAALSDKLFVFIKKQRHLSINAQDIFITTQFIMKYFLIIMLSLSCQYNLPISSLSWYR